MPTPEFAEQLFQRHGYTDLSQIGRGGMGVVYRAWDPRLERLVAVKLLPRELAEAESGRQRFRSEMVTLGRINHSAVVKIHFGDITESGEAYFVMDYIEGDNLGSLIRQRMQWNRRFSVQETVELLRPVAAALDFLHLTMTPPIIHRDVKPENILVPANSAQMESRALLTDFGISLVSEDERLTSFSMMMGTERYFAPEVLPGGESSGRDDRHNEPTAATDNYTLALIAFEMLTLHSYRDTMSQAQWLKPNRPAPEFRGLGLDPGDRGDLAGVTEVFRSALDPNPLGRPRTATAFIQELTRTGNRPAVSNPPAAPQGPQRAVDTVVPGTSSRRSHRGPVIGLSVVAGILAVILAAVSWYAITHPAWSDGDREVAQAFPHLVSPLQNGTGWNGLNCQSGEAQGREQARIECGDADTSVAVVDFGSASARDEEVELAEPTIAWELAGCQFISGQTADGDAAILPGSDHTRFAIQLNDPDAGQLRLQLPLC